MERHIECHAHCYEGGCNEENCDVFQQLKELAEYEDRDTNGCEYCIAVEMPMWWSNEMHRFTDINFCPSCGRDLRTQPVKRNP